MKDFEVKTALTDGQYNAMLRVIEAKGMTQAGYIRHLILQDVANSQDYVALITGITESAETGKIPAQNGAVSGPRGRRVA
mgnify:FL=1